MAVKTSSPPLNSLPNPPSSPRSPPFPLLYHVFLLHLLNLHLFLNSLFYDLFMIAHHLPKLHESKLTQLTECHLPALGLQ